MDKDRALELLDIDTPYSREDVKNSYTTKVLEHHPDQGGDPEKFQEISNARDVAITALPGGAIAPYQPTDNLKLNDHSNIRDQTEKTIDRIVRKQTSRYRRLRRISKVFTALTGLPVFIRLLLMFLPIFSQIRNVSILSEPSTTIIMIMLFISAIYSGVCYWYLRFKIQTIEEMITELDEFFALNSNILSLLQQLPISFDNHSVTDNQLRSAINEWAENSDGERRRGVLGSVLSLYNISGIVSPNLDIQYIARQIGSGDFNRIFIQKCLENGILREQLHLDNPDEMGVRYSLAISD